MKVAFGEEGNVILRDLEVAAAPEASILIPRRYLRESPELLNAARCALCPAGRALHLTDGSLVQASPLFRFVEIANDAPHFKLPLWVQRQACEQIRARVPPERRVGRVAEELTPALAATLYRGCAHLWAEIQADPRTQARELRLATTRDGCSPAHAAWLELLARLAPLCGDPRAEPEAAARAAFEVLLQRLE